jgi:hypothetical protein
VIGLEKMKEATDLDSRSTRNPGPDLLLARDPSVTVLDTKLMVVADTARL